MSPPAVRINNLFPKNNNDCNRVDTISKIFFTLQVPLGIIRFPVCCNVKTIYLVLATVYALTSICLVVTGVYFDFNFDILTKIFIVIATFQYTFCIIYNIFLRKQLEPFYKELNVFDKIAGKQSEIIYETLKNVIHTFLIIAYVLFTYFLPYFVEGIRTITLPYLPIVLTNDIELYFYGHLLSLLVPRLQFINNCLSCPMSSVSNLVLSTTGFSGFHETDKLMNLYHIIVKVYDYLIEAIKWQLLVTLATSFVNLLCCSYAVSRGLLRRECTWTNFVLFLVQAVGVMIPLFAPCSFAGQIHGVVLRMRELLTCRLFQNRHDKGSRVVMRALLSWTEIRDLRLRLLRMLAVDFALPFKFVGLLVTYLIILLQFEKVINP